MRLSCCLCFLLAVVVVSMSMVDAGGAKDVVPALIWSPEKSMSGLEPSFDRTFGADEFHENYLRPLVKTTPAAAVVFLQDKLHGDDFTRFADVYSIDGEGGAFGNIKSLIEENFSLELPQVTSPSDAVQKLQDGYQGQVHSVSSLKDLEGLDLKPSSFLLIVRLPATADRLDREKALKENDALIGEVCKHLSKRSIPYTAVYTGVEASSEQQMSEESGGSMRHLLAEADPPKVQYNGTFMNISNGQSYLFLRDIYLCVANKGKPGCVANFTIAPQNNSAASSVVQNRTANIQLVFNETSPNAGSFQIKFIIDAINQVDRWVIKRMVLYVTPENAGANDTNIQNGTLSKGEMDFVVPILYSFHCTQMRMNLDTLSNGFESFQGTYVVFNGFQFQPFNIQKDQFFNSVDCVGFFTAAIWMGLFPAAILLAILVYGTLMLLDLSIMDRYDDPKGKTISVHNTSSD